MPQIDRLISLFHRRWAVPALAELHALDGAKFVTLANRLGASQTVVRLTLEELIDRGWVRRNSGYGHPLRPEYILTTSGARLAPRCAELKESLDGFGLSGVGLRKWSMPALFVIGDGARRFVEVMNRLSGSTDRAISMTLRSLTGATLVDRRVLETFPPVCAYTATQTGQVLVPILGAI